MREIFFGNFSTKVMALFLAVLTWVYLYTQENSKAPIQVVFRPDLDEGDFAAVEYADASGAPLVPGGYLTVQVTGPQGEIHSLRQRFFVCQFKIDPQELKQLHGMYALTLKRDNFDLPKKFDVDPVRIHVRYAKYVEKTVELVTGKNPCEGEPLAGYAVKSVTPYPQRIQALVPADRPELLKVPVQKVRVEGTSKSFTVQKAEVDRSDPAFRSVKPLQDFSVFVEIGTGLKSRRLTLDLKVAASPEFLKRIELETRTVTVELRGREDLLRDAPETAFAAFIEVTEKDMNPPGVKSLTSLHGAVLDPRYQGQVTAVLMPDEKPEDRKVTVKILPK